MRIDSNFADHFVCPRLYNYSKIRAVNDSIRVLRETFCSRRGVVKLFTTPIRRYNGAARRYIGRSNERTNGPRDLEKGHLSAVVDRYLGDFRELYKDA